jgi:peptidoglycan hydrolase-like protein with peptidoglycan-binding domain
LKKGNHVQRGVSKPIFIVGSPRSGTSILAWCLGHHPNIFPVPESNWMGEFAVNAAGSYQMGAGRGAFSILSAMDISRDEFFSHVGRSIDALILRHRSDLDRKRLITGVQRILKEETGLYSGEINGELNASMTAAIREYQKRNRLKVTGELDAELLDSMQVPPFDSEAKTRWVDGTPEYSFHIYGLRKLFPEALFIHIVRDVTSVVRSMLNFHRIAGIHLAANEEEAYKYWLRTVRGCLKAEQAYGPRVVHRLRYASLLDNPDSAIRSLLDFVGESYSCKCLEPLAERINSSNVPADFKSDDPATDPAIVEEAQRLSAEMEQTSQPSSGSLAAADEMGAAFEQRAQYAATLPGVYQQDKSRLESTLSAYRIENSRLHSAMDAYQMDNAKLGSTIAELRRQVEDLCSRAAQASAEILRITRLLEDRGTKLAEYEQQIVQLANQLGQQRSHTRKLARWLDNAAKAAARLRSSRRWQLVNLGRFIKAKLSHRNVSTGYGHLEKILTAYSLWRAKHPEIVKVDDPIEATRLTTLSSDSVVRSEDCSVHASRP